jgi:hypothetical protein
VDGEDDVMHMFSEGYSDGHSWEYKRYLEVIQNVRSLEIGVENSIPKQLQDKQLQRLLVNT